MKYAQTILNVSIVTMSLVVLSCLVSTMALFMGGGQSGADLRSLMHLQIASVPIALAAISFARIVPDERTSSGIAFAKLHKAVPQWMIFGLLILNCLVASGEAALLVVVATMKEDVVWTAHAPLVSMFTCSFAVCALYGRAQILAGRAAAFSGRWAP